MLSTALSDSAVDRHHLLRSRRLLPVLFKRVRYAVSIGKRASCFVVIAGAVGVKLTTLSHSEPSQLLGGFGVVVLGYSILIVFEDAA